MKYRIMMGFVLLGSMSVQAQVQDTLHISLEKAEQIFLQKNLLLLAQHYQVESSKANEIQQKLYENPSFSTELAAYGGNYRWFDIGGNGQKAFGIDQVILLGSKRRKRVLLAKEETAGVSADFYELMRSLKYELRQSFYTVAYADELIGQYDLQMEQLRRIISAYEIQASARNVPLKDAVRLKAEYIQLSADRNTVVMDAITARQTLALLLDTSSVIVPDKAPLEAARLPELPELIKKARENRPDLQKQQSLFRQEQLNLSYQKALAVPDISLGAGYDQNGNYINNLYTLRASIDLPLFNRNQGNIKAARAQVQSSGLIADYKQKEIETEIAASFARFREAEKEYQSAEQGFNRDFPEVNLSVIENFNKGNISLLEFIDFFENYNTALRQLNQLHKQRRLAWEELEYTTGTRL